MTESLQLDMSQRIFEGNSCTEKNNINKKKQELEANFWQCLVNNPLQFVKCPLSAGPCLGLGCVKLPDKMN